MKTLGRLCTFLCVFGFLGAGFVVKPACADLIGSFHTGALSGGRLGYYTNFGFTLSGFISFPNENLYPVFDSLVFDNTSEGLTFTIASDLDDPDFSALSAFFTNGEDDWVDFSYFIPPGDMAAGGVGMRERLFFSRPDTDAIGYEIDRIELTFITLKINPDENSNWTTFEYEYTVNVFGSLIPEPGTAAMLATGFLALGLIRRSKK